MRCVACNKVLTERELKNVTIRGGKEIFTDLCNNCSSFEHSTEPNVDPYTGNLRGDVTKIDQVTS